MIRSRGAAATARVVAVGFVGLALAACSGDDPNAEPLPSTSTTTTTSTTTSTTPTTTPAPDPRPDEGWAPMTGRWRPSVELLSPGEGERTLLRYRADREREVSFVIRDRWNDSHWTRRMPIDPNRDVAITATAAPLDDGLWFEITGAELTDDPDPLAPEGVAFHFRDNDVQPFIRGDRETARNAAFGLWNLLQAALVPMPDEPVGIGARWQVGADYLYSPPAAVFELVALDGDLVTLAVGGETTSYDGDRYGGNHLDVERSGLIRLDLSSGAAAGVVRGEGVVQQSVTGERTPGTEEPFARETILDIAGTYAALDERTHTITVEYTRQSGGEVTDEVTLVYTGEVETRPDGTMHMAGTVGTSPETVASIPETDLAITPDGGFDAEARFIDSLWSIYRRIVPKFGPDWYLHTGSAPSLTTGVEVGGLCIGGCAEPAEWDIVEVSGSTITATLDHPYSLDISQRGAITRAEGVFRGEWTIDLFDPFAFEGSLAYEGSSQLGEAFSVSDLRETWVVTTAVG